MLISIDLYLLITQHPCLKRARCGAAQRCSPRGTCRRLLGHGGRADHGVGADLHQIRLGACLQRRRGGCDLRCLDDAHHLGLQLLRRNSVRPFRYRLSASFLPQNERKTSITVVLVRYY